MPLFVSIGIASRQLLRPELANEVRHLLGRAVMPKGSLRLEIGEYLIMENPEQAGAVLESLTAAGAGLALDEFGTGYSSLSYLGQLAFDTIKVDRAFVQGRGQNGSGGAMLRSIVALAKELGRKVAAEGVETEDDIAFLRSIGCEYAQGAYYGELMSDRDVSQLLKVVRRAERRLKRKRPFRQGVRPRPEPAHEPAAQPAAAGSGGRGTPPSPNGARQAPRPPPPPAGAPGATPVAAGPPPAPPPMAAAPPPRKLPFGPLPVPPPLPPSARAAQRPGAAASAPAPPGASGTAQVAAPPPSPLRPAAAAAAQAPQSAPGPVPPPSPASPGTPRPFGPSLAPQPSVPPPPGSLAPPAAGPGLRPAPLSRSAPAPRPQAVASAATAAKPSALPPVQPVRRNGPRPGPDLSKLPASIRESLAKLAGDGEEEGAAATPAGQKSEIGNQKSEGKNHKTEVDGAD
jgi:EAL domain-containing protein (putative c-di-GMP-specific phosphodiesterase class I)